MLPPLDSVQFSITINKLNTIYSERVNNIYAEVLIASLVIILYLRYKLKYWTWQGIPNEVSSIYNRFTRPFHEADLESYKKYGKVVGIYEGLRPVLMVGDLCLIRQILIKDFHKFPNHRVSVKTSTLSLISSCQFCVDGGSKIGSNFLFVLKYSEWNRVRTIITPAFSIEKIEQMKPLIKSSLDVLIHNLEVSSINGYPVDVMKFLSAFTMDVITNCAFGTRVNSMQNPENELVRKAKQIWGQNIKPLSLVANLYPTVMRYGSWFYPFDYDALDYLHKFVSNVLNQRRASRENHRSDFIQTLLDSESLLSQVEMIDQGMLFLITGYDTTSAALASAAFCLATHPDCQERLYHEIESFLDSFDDFDYAAISSLKYLDAFICETLRLMPPAPRIERRAVVDCTIGDIFIPKGTLIVIPVYAIHHDEDYFKNAEEFDPERFLNQEKYTNPFSFLPFAAGARNCIGMTFALFQIKMCLIYLVHKLRFSVCDQTKIPLEYYRGKLVSTPKEVTLKVTKR